jgi:hypothetical protein
MGPTTVEDASTPTREELERLRRQIIELQRICSLGVLAGGICHELNNALTPILNYAKLGLRNPDPEYHRRAFEKILEGSQRMALICGGVLGLARPQLDRYAPTDLIRLAEEVVLLTSKDLRSHRIALDFQAAGRPFAPVNPAQIQQVLINLIINARQAMPGGGDDPAGGRDGSPRADGRDLGGGLRRRDRAAGSPADLRALLHDQGRPGLLRARRDGARALGLPRHHRGPQGATPGPEQGRLRLDLHPEAPPLPRSCRHRGRADQLDRREPLTAKPGGHLSLRIVARAPARNWRGPRRGGIIAPENS